MSARKKAIPGIGTREEAIVRYLRILGDKWSPIDLRKISKTEEDAIEDLIAVGAAQGAMTGVVRQVHLGKMIRVKLTVFGEFHEALEKELEKLVPQDWRQNDWLEQKARLSAIRATYMGRDYKARLGSEKPIDVATALLAEPVRLGIVRLWGKPRISSRPQPTCHAIDFRSVNWFGTEYGFTATQAACVKVLWEHWERGAPEIGDQTVLEAAEVATTTRLDALFRDSHKKSHPAWGKMIQAGRTRGTHRLIGP